MFNNTVEKMTSALKDMSITTRKYYVELLEQGFSEEQAFTLVVEMQKALMGVGVNQS